jgi:hypothetical protein
MLPPSVVSNSFQITLSTFSSDCKAKSNIKIEERGKMDIPSTQIHDSSLSCLDTDRVKLVLWTQPSPLIEMRRG